MQRSVTLEERDIPLLGLPLLEKMGEGRAVLFGAVLRCKIVVGRLERENGVKTCASPLTTTFSSSSSSACFSRGEKNKGKREKGHFIIKKILS